MSIIVQVKRDSHSIIKQNIIYLLKHTFTTYITSTIFGTDEFRFVISKVLGAWRNLNIILQFYFLERVLCNWICFQWPPMVYPCLVFSAKNAQIFACSSDVLWFQLFMVCLLLLISMLCHRQTIFESQCNGWDKLALPDSIGTMGRMSGGRNLCL